MAAPGIGIGRGERGLEAMAAGLGWGSKDFREELLEMIGRKQGLQHYELHRKMIGSVNPE
jgi:hypothetical protein